ncbi:MAG: GNAT family N-acetyltransferase [Silicimonas sp.]|nr:GNAT family N-acetyltransferase [Silicimonas sp.]
MGTSCDGRGIWNCAGSSSARPGDVERAIRVADVSDVLDIRRAGPEDAAACARIVNDWVDRTDWMPRVISRETIEGYVSKAMMQREVYVIGDPVEGYLSLDPETATIGALYLENPGRGHGKALMDRAKADRDYLQLWTHEPNKAAHRFYFREGFELVGRKPKGEDNLPELRMEWHR